ncbi:MAG: glycosyltransferase family 39 protein [Candidatus Omnitrophica bacterium]|nr:glycosyltransferase family 39 protein [Candidatus Omnitrophota bacterium]
MPRSFLPLFLILLSGAMFRAIGLDFGLPHILHQDEPIVINHALAYGTGDLNPHFFIIPPLCSYILFILYGFFYVVGMVTGLFHGIDDFAYLYVNDPTAFFIIARVFLGILPAVMGIFLVYRLFKDFFGSEIGAIFASFFTSVSFIGVVNAHYGYTDNLMVMFVLLAVLYLYRLVKSPCPVNYVLSGVFIGLAVGTKYNAAVLAVSLAWAHCAVLLGRRGRKNGHLWLMFLAAAAVFTVVFIGVNPFSVLDREHFLRTVFGGIRHGRMGWDYHLRYSMVEGIGILPVVLGLTGFAAILFRTNFRTSLLFLSFPVMFYVHLVFASQRYARYGLPLLPFFAMAAAYLLFVFPGRRGENGPGRFLVIALALAALVPTAVMSVKADILFSGPDTRVVSAKWIEENIPEGTRIAVDNTSFRPQIYQTKEQLEDKSAITDRQFGLGAAKKKKLGYMLKSAENKRTYNVYFFIPEGKTGGQFLSTMPTIAYDVSELKRSGIEYVVINLQTVGVSKDNLMASLSGKAVPVKTFSPYNDGRNRAPYDMADATFMAVSARELFSRKMTGPCITIYKLEL